MIKADVWLEEAVDDYAKAIAGRALFRIANERGRTIKDVYEMNHMLWWLGVVLDDAEGA